MADFVAKLSATAIRGIAEAGNAVRSILTDNVNLLGWSERKRNSLHLLHIFGQLARPFSDSVLVPPALR
jgi:hypothetical protein